MLHYGAIYYPEHWPEERWGEDARLMREAGFNVVRLGEFAWRRMEPRMDRFEFDWLRRAVDILHAEGISVLLGTPTAGPPAWLVNAPDPALDCRMVYEGGVRWDFGGRSLCCVNHPHFVERSRRIAQAMAEHFAAHPAVMGWQLDNELGMYGTRCYCAHCLRGFRAWLQRKYGDVAALNERLGMVFGGGEFLSFEDVPIPRLQQDLHNPGLLLDSQRFFSDSNVAYLRMQAEALRGAGARQPITTNVCHMFGGAESMDGRALFEALDVAGWDCYPVQFAADPAPATMALLHAVARGYKGRRYWMLEQQSGAPFGMPCDDPRRIRLWTWQSIAHGAEMILYFRWRTCRFGGEQDRRGILDHVGTVNDRYRTVAQVGGEIARLGACLDDLAHERRAAILLDYESYLSLLLGVTAGAPRLRYREHAEGYYEALRRRGLPPDVIYAPPEPGRYDLVVAPALRMMDADWARRLRAFVEQGGTLVATICTATLTRDHVAPTGPLPWLLDDVFGVVRTGWSALGTLAAPADDRVGEDAAAWAGRLGGDAIPVIGEAGPLEGTYPATVWCDHLRAAEATVLARFAGGSPPGPAPAVTANHFGQGRAVYVAAVVGQELLDRLAAYLAARPEGLPTCQDEAVEIVPCRTAAGLLCFVLNHGPCAAQVSLPARTRDLLVDRAAGPVLRLGPYDVAILALE